MQSTEERIVHGYDTTAHRVLCGIAQQANSTKHLRLVTCTTCRERMLAADRPAPPVGV